jgi:branched-chain amino acid transport system substrate-binding protein
LRIARVLEGAGRTAAARAEYAWATGSSRGEEAATAWDGIARLRRRDSDPVGAAIAEIEACRAAPDGARSEREAALRRTAASLEPGILRRLARTSGAGGGLLSAELERRGLAAGTGPERVIALLLPLSGRFESFGRAFRTGAEVALADRQSARPGTRPIRLLVEDTAGDLFQATAAARRAILDEGAVALLGPLLSVPALGAGAIAECFGVPLVAPTATDPQVDQVGTHVVALRPSARALTEPLAAAIVDDLGLTRVGALVPREAAAEEREREFRAALERHGGQIVLSVSYEPAERDFRKLLEKLEDAGVQAVYAPGLEALVPQLEFYDFRPRLLGHAGWASARVREPGRKIVEGALLTVQAVDDPGSLAASSLRQAVAERESAEPMRFHVEGYRAMATVLFAIDRGASRPESLTEALLNRSGWAERPEVEQVRLLTIRGGALAPADSVNLRPAASPNPGAPGSSAPRG